MNRIQEASWRLALSEGSPVAQRRVASGKTSGDSMQPALQRLIASLKRPPPRS